MCGVTVLEWSSGLNVWLSRNLTCILISGFHWLFHGMNFEPFKTFSIYSIGVQFVRLIIQILVRKTWRAHRLFGVSKGEKKKKKVEKVCMSDVAENILNALLYRQLFERLIVDLFHPCLVDHKTMVSMGLDSFVHQGRSRPLLLETFVLCLSNRETSTLSKLKKCLQCSCKNGYFFQYSATLPPVCPSKTFQCGSSKTCIDEKKVCDGNPQCPHGEDERNCGMFKSIFKPY